MRKKMSTLSTFLINYLVFLIVRPWFVRERIIKKKKQRKFWCGETKLRIELPLVFQESFKKARDTDKD